MLKNIVVLCITIASAKAQRSYEDPWQGRFFPHYPNEMDLNPAVVSDNTKTMQAHHGAPMGVADTSCDNAKMKLEVDWYNDTRNYTCLEDKTLYLPQATVHPIHTVDHIPKGYVARHKCMNHSILYDKVIPTFGNHRPLWSKYGEYTFIPQQRWLHNMEHGAMVMLYHPCADENEVDKLRRILVCCLYRHIITPNNLLSPERPLALVTWGHLFEMSKVDPPLVMNHIKEHALKGPEHTSKNGQYSWMLKEDAQVPPHSNKYDQYICHKCENIGCE